MLRHHQYKCLCATDSHLTTRPTLISFVVGFAMKSSRVSRFDRVYLLVLGAGRQFDLLAQIALHYVIALSASVSVCTGVGVGFKRKRKSALRRPIHFHFHFDSALFNYLMPGYSWKRDFFGWSHLTHVNTPFTQ